MPEIKNTFLKSKMNKDLDSRIIPNGEYRDGQNISVSTSEGADVGALENIRGNISITDFGLNDIDLKVIGSYVDIANSRVFLFITNNNDNSTGLPKIINSGSNNGLIKNNIGNYICYFSVDKDGVYLGGSILVAGSFLNFSKNNPINNVNLIEDLLFFTDNRNQPRKINVRTAIGQPFIDESNRGYYQNEDQISVAKYAPFESISFLKKLNKQDLNFSESTLKNETDEFMPPFIALPCKVGIFPEVGSGRQFLKVNNEDIAAESYSGANNSFYSDLRNFLTDGSGGFNFNFSNIDGSVNNTGFKVKVSIYGETGFQDAFIDFVSSNGNVYLQTFNGEEINSLGANSKIDWDLEVGNPVKIAFSLRNPHYNENFSETGDEDLLKEKFARFSYRFKYDDDEYSLIAPFSQHAFVPKQFGYFIGDDSRKTKESSIVSFMVNQINSAGLVINLPCRVNEMYEKLKVKELQVLYKASDEQAIKVVTDINFKKSESIRGIPDEIELNNDLTSVNQTGYTLNKIYKTSGGTGTGLTIKVTGVNSGAITSFEIAYCGSGYKIGDSVEIENGNSINLAFAKVTKLSSTYIHEYRSEKPIKVLPENEIVRVSDIVPVKAKTQEAIGNRIVYGNFQQTTQSPESLKYNVKFETKTIVSTQSSPTLQTGVELNNHTLKQGRSYQVGIVLQDRYGRSSNVILADETGSYNSTFFARYMNGGSDPLSWLGNSINVIFDEKIPTESNGDYVGLWSESNPMGWYSYKVVVKQQEQDYFNIYTPGSVSGNVRFTKWTEELKYLNTKSVSNITLFNDNINKIPRDLKETAATDKVYSSSIELINRVNQTSQIVSGVPVINGQALFPYENSDIITLRPFRELGDWTIYKGVNLQFTTIGPAAVDVNNGTVSGTPANPYTSPTYIYPGSDGEVDPFFLDNNKNPIISTISTNKRIGLSELDQNSHNFAKELTIFETKPIKSNLEIYYETSTSGTIESLNFNIENVVSPSNDAVGVTSISIFGLEETDQFNQQPYSNQFQCIDSTGNFATDPSCRIFLELVEYSIDGGSNWNAMDMNPDSSNVPQYLAGEGFLSGNFNTHDLSNPFKIVEVISASPTNPPIYQLFTKRPLNIFSANETKFRFTFRVTQQPGINIVTNPIEAIEPLLDLKPKIGVIGLPTKNGIYTDQSKYQPATHVFKDWSKDLDGISRIWNHYKFNTNNDLVEDWNPSSGSYPDGDWDCKAGSYAPNVTDPENGGWYSSYSFSFQDLNAPGWFFKAENTDVGQSGNLNGYGWGSMEPFRVGSASNYWCEIAYSTNGMTVLNTPNWKDRTSWGGTVNEANEYAINPSDIETDWSIRNANATQQFPANPTSSNNNILVKNTRLDATSVSNSNYIVKSNGSSRFSNGIQFKVTKGYVQKCVSHNRAIIRHIGDPHIIPGPSGSLTPFGSSFSLGIDLDSFKFNYYENAYSDSNGGSIHAVKGVISQMSSAAREKLFNDIVNGQVGGTWSVLFTVYVVAEDAGTGLQSDPYIVKFYLHP